MDGAQQTRSLASLIQPREDGEDVIDHIDRSTLNNNIDNLRGVTFSENSFNCTKRANATSKYRGVTFDKGMKKYCVHSARTINPLGAYKNIFLGHYVNELHAAYAYNEFMQKFPTALLNIDEDGQPLTKPHDYVLHVPKKKSINVPGVYVLSSRRNAKNPSRNGER